MSCLGITNSALVQSWVIGTTDILGIVLNGFCVVCLSQIVYKKSERVGDQARQSNMFNYMLVQAACNFAYFLVDVFYIRSYCQSCHMIGTLASVVWKIYFTLIFEVWMTFIQSFMELAASVDCYLLITSRSRYLRTRLAFWIVLASSVAFAVIYHIYLFFTYEIKSTQRPIGSSNQTYTYYYYVRTPFGLTSTFRNYLVIFRTIIRDVLVTVLIVAFNTLILYEMRKASKRRAAMTTSRTNQTGESSKSRASRQAERKKAIMIVIMGVNYVIGHFPYAVYSIQYFFFAAQTSNKRGWTCFGYVASKLWNASYVTLFFYVFFFNMHFRRLAVRNVKTVLLLLTCSFQQLREQSQQRDTTTLASTTKF